MYEEHLFYRKLKQLWDKNQLTPQQRRLYRKLSLRNVKKSLGMEFFNFDALAAKLSGQEWTEAPKLQEEFRHSITNVLDRFQKGHTPISQRSSKYISFRARLVGTEDHIPQSFISPYTGRYNHIHILINTLSLTIILWD